MDYRIYNYNYLYHNHSDNRVEVRYFAESDRKCKNNLINFK